MPPGARAVLVRLVSCAVTVAAGLASRLPAAPGFVHAYVGDALYAALVHQLLGLVRPRGPNAGLAFALCVAVEVSQAFHPAWLDALRAHRLVALVLGRGFLWTDLACYAVGVALAAGCERAVRRGSLAAEAR